MKKAVVIGASSGIGAALAKELDRKGYHVGMAARRLEQMEALAAEMKGPAVAKRIDVARHDEAAEHLAELAAELGGMDVLILCAGVGVPIKEIEWEREKFQIEVNVLGFAAMAVAGFEYFKERGAGHIVGISSVAALRGNRVNPVYSASKAFMCRYLEGMRLFSIKEGLNIAFTDIRPGFVTTEMTKDKNIGPLAVPVDAAARDMVRAIERRQRTAYVPAPWKLIELPYQLIPDALYEKF